MVFDVHILGSNSALPTIGRFSSCQVVNFREKLFMIDCGEGAQIQMRKQRLKFSRLNHIFLSHLHGDHVFGLPGLVSTFGLLNRTADLHVYAPDNLESIMRPFINFFAHKLPFKLIFHKIDAEKHAIIYEDRSLQVFSVPLRHRIPTCGFLFREKPGQCNIRKDMIDFYKLSVKEIKQVKEGADFIKADGTIIPNERLTIPPATPRSYAYCSDTMYKPDNADILNEVSLLYHEATFADEDELRVSGTYHSTASQAAKMAKLSNAGRLLIGHFSARYLSVEPLLINARNIFENTVAVEDGMRFEV
jgi:ribonuclease Z